jgi:hypothetical protein
LPNESEARIIAHAVRAADGLLQSGWVSKDER